MTRRELDLERARKVLRVLIGLSGLSRREVQRRLQRQGSITDVTRILRGKLDLKLRHILDIVEVLDVQAFEFFQMAFPPPPRSRPSPVLEMLESTLAPDRQPDLFRSSLAPPVTGDEERLRHRRSELMRQFEQLISEATERREK
jgi:predicted ATPase